MKVYRIYGDNPNIGINKALLAVTCSAKLIHGICQTYKTLFGFRNFMVDKEKKKKNYGTSRIIRMEVKR